MNEKKQLVIVIGALVGSAAILVTAYVANGSEREDAWLYVLSGMFVLWAAYELYTGLKNRKR